MKLKLRLFKASLRLDDDLLVVTPCFEPGMFPYNEFHYETNALRTYIMRENVRNLILNFNDIQYVGSEFIGTMVSLKVECHNNGGRVAICGLADVVAKTLETLQVFEGCAITSSLDAAEACFNPVHDASVK